ncbi:MAG: Hsp20/alpha crystallin family protein [Bacteroidetes bacterium]|nr:Hsp20/alpha crystallin family protein [Bacteroidota bacterium]
MTNIIKKADGRPATFGSVVDQLFQTNLDHFFDDRNWGFNGLRRQAQAPVNIGETDTAYELHLAAPGLRKEDLRLNYAGNSLTVSFERPEKANESGYKWIHREFGAQPFTRTFTIDETVDAEKASARYVDGVLVVTLPKKENSGNKSRTINVD